MDPYHEVDAVDLDAINPDMHGPSVRPVSCVGRYVERERSVCQSTSPLHLTIDSVYVKVWEPDMQRYLCATFHRHRADRSHDDFLITVHLLHSAKQFLVLRGEMRPYIHNVILAARHRARCCNGKVNMIALVRLTPRGV